RLAPVAGSPLRLRPFTSPLQWEGFPFALVPCAPSRTGARCMFAPRRSLLLLTLLLAACQETPPPLDFTRAEPGEQLSGGAATVNRSDVNAFSLPSANLPPSRRLDFNVGNSFFRNPWVIAPASTTARDGLGPLFNTNACQNCHIKDGRGHPPANGALHSVSMLVRISLPAGPEHAEQVARQGVRPDPV